MKFDTLSYAGVEKDFASWGFGLHSIKGKKRANAMDDFISTIVISTIAAEADAPTFAFEGKVVVRVNRTGPGGAGTYSGGTTKFVGKRVGQPSKANASGQGVTYQFHGPMYDLMNTDYQQTFKGNGATYLLPEVVLFTSAALSSGWIQISVGDQIQAILQFILDQYAAQGMTPPFQYKGRALNSGAIDLNAGASFTGTPGGNRNFYGGLFTYALQTGMSIDSSLFSLFLPTFIEKPMKCAQALQKCLELSPRINMWFDYTAVDGSGNPLPTIRFDLVDNMTAVNLPLFTGPKYDGTVSQKDISITPRDDLMIRAAIIKYRITSTSGVKVIDYAVDKWSGNGTSGGLPGAPHVNLDGTENNVTDPNCGLRVLNELIDLQGIQTQTLKGHLDLELLANIGGTQASKRVWWSSKRGGEMAKLEDSRARFQDKYGAQTGIPDATINYASNGFDSTGVPVLSNQEFTAADYAFYAYRIVRGTYQAWMAQSAGILAVKCKAVAKVTFAEYDCYSSYGSTPTSTTIGADTAGFTDTDRTNGGKSKQHLINDLHVNLELTNAIPDSGTSGYANFSILASSTPGEGYIIGSGGIAQYLYDHLNVRQFEGDYVSVCANFMDSSSSQYVTLGNKLNLTGGATLWTTMNAQIMEINEDYGTHQTTVRVGISRHLSAGGLSSLLNMFRFRRTWYNPAIRTDNNVSNNGEVDMAKANGQANTTNGLEVDGQVQHFDYSTPPSGSIAGVIAGAINNDPALITSTLAATTPTAVAPAAGPDPLIGVRTMRPQEVCFKDAAGNDYFALVHCGDFYTKP